ncbi:dihydroxyacetone kinase 1 [Infundibulicybe gibba]|nr:dihydroxyacetone kinase 1 [Infundibulicybe gibba]
MTESIQSKHFLNTPASLVLDSLRGLCAVNPQLALDAQNKIVYVASPDRTKVALLCGGGSGHEPAHAGFVGKGILSGAVCGNIFASPSASQVRRGIDLVSNDRGTIIIVKNYTGDILNFGLAKEQYAALHPDQADRVKFVIVGEDVAVGRKQGSIVGRRGLAGTVLVYKIAGALAERGGSLDAVYNISQWVASNIVTIGVGLEHCHVPGTAAAASHLATSEIEIGMGIHNESGHRRISPVPPLNDLIAELTELLTSTTDPDRSFLPFQGDGSDNVVLLVNNLGGVSELELGGIVAEVQNALKSRKIAIQRILAGSFMTSLNMPGFSITLLLLPRGNADDVTTPLVLSLLDDKAETPGWKWSPGSLPSGNPAQTTDSAVPEESPSMIKIASRDPDGFVAAITRACHALISAEPGITHMDRIAGDGDCGLTLKAGAEGVLRKVADGTVHGNDVIQAGIAIAQVAEEAMGGTSGALYSIFFSALAQGLASQSMRAGDVVAPEAWAQALSSALAKFYTYTRARAPSRTLVDPLASFVETYANNPKDIRAAVKAAASAAEATKYIAAKVGRSAYVEGDRLKEQMVADPGAWGVKVILKTSWSEYNVTFIWNVYLYEYGIRRTKASIAVLALCLRAARTTPIA